MALSIFSFGIATLFAFSTKRRNWGLESGLGSIRLAKVIAEANLENILPLFKSAVAF